MLEYNFILHLGMSPFEGFPLIQKNTFLVSDSHRRLRKCLIAFFYLCSDFLMGILNPFKHFFHVFIIKMN